MGYFKNNLSKTHAIVFAFLLIVFSALTFRITSGGMDDGPEKRTRVVQTTLGTITGPLTGAISRGFQDCCLEFSLTVMAYCSPLLVIGLIAQFVALPQRWGINFLRMGLWTIGWLAWFAGGIVSFGHALS